MILVVAEQREGVMNRATWESVAAAQEMAAHGSGPVKVVVVGATVAPVAAEVASADVAEVLVVDDPALEPYTSDGFVAALIQVVDAEHPDVVLFPHTYQTRDYAPTLATRCQRALVTDCIGLKRGPDGVLFVRPMFQGKFVADITVQGPAPHFASFQIGAYRADGAARGTASAPTRGVDVTLDPSDIRQRPEAPFKEAKHAVDLTQAERIVAVGRGDQGTGASSGRSGVGESARRRSGGDAPDLRRRVVADGRVRLEAQGKQSRRSCIWRSGSLVRSSTSSG